ncbi:MAG: hypothetical protein WA662_24735, partial [Pseudolabrys sp.]
GPIKRWATFQTPSCGGVVPKTNEWNLLKRQFDALVRDDGAGPDSIELDADFRRRFAALMNRVCGPSKYYQKADPFPRGS